MHLLTIILPSWFTARLFQNAPQPHKQPPAWWTSDRREDSGSETRSCRASFIALARKGSLLVLQMTEIRFLDHIRMLQWRFPYLQTAQPSFCEIQTKYLQLIRSFRGVSRCFQVLLPSRSTGKDDLNGRRRLTFLLSGKHFQRYVNARIRIPAGVIPCTFPKREGCPTQLSIYSDCQDSKPWKETDKPSVRIWMRHSLRPRSNVCAASPYFAGGGLTALCIPSPGAYMYLFKQRRLASYIELLWGVPPWVQLVRGWSQMKNTSQAAERRRSTIFDLKKSLVWLGWYFNGRCTSYFTWQFVTRTDLNLFETAWMAMQLCCSSFYLRRPIIINFSTMDSAIAAVQKTGIKQRHTEFAWRHSHCKQMSQNITASSAVHFKISYWGTSLFCPNLLMMQCICPYFFW